MDADGVIIRVYTAPSRISYSLRTPPNSSRRAIAAAKADARARRKSPARYAVAITPALADLIDPSDPHDPMARQFVPDRA